MNKPTINVTPLIDVLLVLLIIFMVISPLKPAAFKAKIPHELQNTPVDENIKTLVVLIGSDGSLTLNREAGLGTIDDSSKLTDRLKDVFLKRTENLDQAENQTPEKGIDSPDGIERTVFIKAPKNFPYGEVAKVVDAVKLGGAAPISLQVDSLE
ncbi:MAG: biopolymer transporter ExbD [Acidobacteriota bacterium]